MRLPPARERRSVVSAGRCAGGPGVAARGSLAGLDGGVAEGLEGLGDGVGRACRRDADIAASEAHVELVLELDDDAGGGALAEAGGLREGAGVAGRDGCREGLGGHGGEHGVGQPRPDAGHADEQGEELQGVLCGEAVKLKGVVADDEVRVQVHGRADGA